MSDNVFVGSKARKLYAVNAASGTKVWEFATGDAVYSSPTVADGLVFVGSMDKKLYALTAANGAKVWEFAITPRLWSREV